MELKQELLGKLVKLQWLDSAFQHGWQYGKEKPECDVVTTYGVVIYLDGTVIEIASTIAETRGVLNPLAIPIGCVIKMEELK